MMEMSKAAPPTVPIGEFTVPRHVAIIMDGNGRWAAARGLPRGEGHRRGVEALRRTVRAAGDLGIGILTIFSFSAENWSRPPSEIRELMGLLRRFIRNDLADLHRNGVHVRVIGDRDDLAPDIRSLLEEAEELTRDNDKLTLVVAFNYGARQEIARAAQRLAAEVAAGRLAVAEVTADKLASLSRCPGSARPRSHHPHQRRAAPVQFPALAGGLQRARFRARSTGRISTAPRSSRPSSNFAAASAGSAGSSPRPDRERWRTPIPPILRAPSRARGGELVLRVCSALVLAPLAVGIAYLGGWPFAAVLEPRGDRGVLGMELARRRRGSDA